MLSAITGERLLNNCGAVSIFLSVFFIEAIGLRATRYWVPMQLSGMNQHEPGTLLVSMTYTSGVSITQDAEISTQPEQRAIVNASATSGTFVSQFLPESLM